MLHALVVDDDMTTLEALSDLVRKEGFEVTTARSLEQALAELGGSSPDLVLLDGVLPDGNGLDLLRNLDVRSSTEVVLITGYGSNEDSLRAFQLGASNYLRKPVDPELLRSILENVSRTHELRREVTTLRKRLRRMGQFGSLLGNSTAMQQLYDQVSRVGPTNASVLIVGESGTGKELVAQSIHEFSRRRTRLFLPVNCGAISPNLIESELFGHERGSFTGANKLHKGYFERAEGGTLFLDEITEMPIELQVKLLRVLENGTILRVGGNEHIEVDVRVIAATNRSPEDAVKDGRLRDDLLYRLNVFPVHVPPLRERAEDIELLAGHFLADLNQSHGTSKRFSRSALDTLRTYRWPGNVRELKNVIQRAFIVADEVMGPECLSCPAEAVRDVPVPERKAPKGACLEIPFGVPLAEVERRVIFETLETNNWNKKRTAEVLGISLRTLYNRLKDYETSN